MNAAAPVSDKPDPLIKPVSTDKDGEALTGLHFERQVERVHNLGPRPLAELLAEIAIATGESDLIADRVEAYSRLDPAVLRAIGGDRFPPMPLEVVR